MNPSESPPAEVRVTRHEGADDLLSAGLGLAGLRAPAAPAPADPAAPTAAELRRRALHANWRGIADLARPGVSAADRRAGTRILDVPARERGDAAASRAGAGARRVRCGQALPGGGGGSGSRGVYGAIAVAGAWALPRGCAVAYTDKGNGTGFHDFDSDTGVALDGTRAVARRGRAGARSAAHRVRAAPGGDQARALGRQPGGRLGPSRAAGRGVRPACARSRVPDAGAVHAGEHAHPRDRISNGGGAVLRAGELPEATQWFDAVVVGEPNVVAPGARPFYDSRPKRRCTNPARCSRCRMRPPCRRTRRGAPRRWRAARAIRAAGSGRVLRELSPEPPGDRRGAAHAR